VAATDDNLQAVIGRVDVTLGQIAPIVVTVNRMVEAGYDEAAFDAYEPYGVYEVGEYEAIEAEDTGNLIVFVQFGNAQNAETEEAAAEEELEIEAQVSVVGPNDYRSEITTEGTLEELESGAYVVAATAEGYNMAQGVVEVRQGEAATVTLTLEPLEGVGVMGALSPEEFERGVFGVFAGDDDVIDEEEFDAGVNRLYGGEYELGFSDFDADADGVITEAEFNEAYEGDLYNEFDADADGGLTGQELAIGLYGRFDADGDGVVTAEEYEPYEGWFGYDYTELDADANGQLTEDEFLGGF
jgi:hypothetical protein